MNLIEKSVRYWETLRPLKFVQFYGRVWFNVYRPAVYMQTAIQALCLPMGRWQRPVVRAASMTGAAQFRFLNQIQTLALVDGWNDSRREKLWLYNLHYFDDLNAINANDRNEWHKKLIARWITENPPTIGNGWESYPTSLRIVNWVKWLCAGNAPIPGMLESLGLQASWLAKRLEWHLLGNHLFANAKALVFAGLLFEGKEADFWLKKGLKILNRELQEQVLPDGGNFERSPMYHAIFLEDVLDLVNAATYWPGRVGCGDQSKWCETATRMLEWLKCMIHPDGEIAFFNDSAFGVSPGYAELRTYAERLGIRLQSPINNPYDGEASDEVTILEPSVDREETRGMLSHVNFKESGYIRLETDLAMALLDVAPIGPDYLPGHAHADTLSFEMSVHSQRVVVNGGTSQYGLGPVRLRERGTAAHSTVEVAGQDSSEVWGGFRVARRAYPFDLQVKSDASVLKVACSHDGYKHLSGSPVHRRMWTMDTDSLQVRDTVYGGAHSALARYILHPDVMVAFVENNTWQLTLASGHNVCLVVLAGLGRIEPANYAPEFGIVFSTKCLVVELNQGQSCVKWIWG